jgi:hypothetical protein
MSDIVSDAPHRAVIAQPISEHEWQVCANRSGSIEDTQAVFGYISELGGTSEVHVLQTPEGRQYVPTFKDAMDCFEVVT